MKTIKSLLLLFSFLGLQSSYASHVAGGEIRYQFLGNNKYKITATFYRDCNGISMDSLIFGVFAGNNGSMSCGQFPLTINRIGIKDITPVCKTASGPCNPTNTGFTGEGIEEHTFETTVDFTKAPFKNFVNNSSCCEVTFYISQCCWNSAVTTGPANNRFFSTCMINLCHVKKTSRAYNSNPVLSNTPIIFGCCNQPYFSNCGAIDTLDYDSISYQLVHGIEALPNTSVNYSSPFTAKNPMTPFCIPPTSITCTPNPKTDPTRGFFLDENTGDIIFTPTKCDETGVVVVEISEFRKDTLGNPLIVGKSRRDINIKIKDDCGYNRAPKLNGPFNTEVCEGEKICFKIYGTDETFIPHQSIPDTVSINWDGGIPEATFKVLNPSDREKEAEFCWQTKKGQASLTSYAFSVTVSDGHCPRPNIVNRGFRIKVKPKGKASPRFYRNLKCSKGFEFKAEQVNPGKELYTWSFTDSLGQNSVFHSSQKQDTIKLDTGGRFIVNLRVNNPFVCPNTSTDTVYIPNLAPSLKVKLPKDTFACGGSDLILNSKILHAKNPYRYYWSKSFLHASGDTLPQLVLKSITKNDTIILHLTDGDSCVALDTMRVEHKPLPEVNIGLDQRICAYDSIVFDAGHNDTMLYLWNNQKTTQKITVKDSGEYVVVVRDKRSNCIAIDSVHLFVNEPVRALAGLDSGICEKDTIDLQASHAPLKYTAVYQWKDVLSGSILGSTQVVSINPKLPFGDTQFTHFYALQAQITQDGLTCNAIDTVAITVKKCSTISVIPIANSKFSFNIIPNPAHATFKLNQDLDALQIFDIAGREVYSFGSYTNGTAIFILEFNSGIYTVVGHKGFNKALRTLVVNKP